MQNLPALAKQVNITFMFKKTLSSFKANCLRKRATHACVAATVLYALGAGSATSQTRPFTAAEALKDIQPAGQACRRDDVPKQPTVLSGRASSPPDITCMVTAQELGLWVSAGQMLVVDTRHSNEYAQFHINSALNLSAAEVMHKAQLRSKAIVLVGNGKLERELYSACAELKAKGFTSVKVLRGGMPAWLEASQPITGRSQDAALLRRLESADLLAESQSDLNLVVLTPAEIGLQPQLTSAIAVQKDTPDQLTRLLEQRRKETKGAAMNAVVLVASPKTTLAVLAQWQAAAAPLPLLVYQEGTPAFQRFLTDQKAVWLAQARGPKQPACGS